MAALNDDVIEEILLRVPPDEPASLVRAALACKRWCHLVSDPGFHRRFREFHLTPPLLGVIYNNSDDSDDEDVFDPIPTLRFVPTSSYPPRVGHRGWRALDARHGRVLLHSVPWGGSPQTNSIKIWNPITNEQQQLPKLPLQWYPGGWNAAVLCAAGDDCDHLNCHQGYFFVVFLGINHKEMFTYIYSSEANAWSKVASCRRHCLYKYFEWGAHIPLIGKTLYFLAQRSIGIVKYDMAMQKISVIRLLARIVGEHIVLMPMENGRLGYATVHKSKIYLFEVDTMPNKDTEGASRVIELDKLLPANTLRWNPYVNGFADGVKVLFMQTIHGLTSIDLKSGRVRMVPGRYAHHNIIPYLSFYNPGLRATCAGDGSAAGASSA